MSKVYEDHKFITVVAPDDYDSDTELVSSDNDNGVLIQGLRGVYFGVMGGDVTATGSFVFQVAYSSTGNASDASTSTTVWASSDAAVTLDSDNVNAIAGLYVDLEAKNLTDAVGKLFITNAVSPKGADFGIFAVTDPATATLPVTQEATTILANCTS